MNTNRLLICLLLLVIATTLRATSERIPFQLAGNLIVLQGSVDGQTGNFILDTGVSDLILNKRYFRGQSSGNFFQAFNGKVDEVASCFPTVEIGANQWKRVYAEVISMEQLEGSKSIPIHGLIGSQLFREYILLIDYENFEIELYPLNKKGENPEFSELPLPVGIFPFKNKGGAPLITTQIHGVDFKLTIDSGAEINLMEDKWLDKRPVWEQEQRTEYSIGGLGNQAKQVTMVNISNMQMGNITCRPMRTGFIDLDQWNHTTYGPIADGILGYEFLSQFLIAINFKKRELYVWELGEQADPLLAGGRK